MAIVRMTMEEVKASRPNIDRVKMLATAEDDIARQMIEDGENPSEHRTYSPILNPRNVRAKLNMTQAEFAEALHVPLRTLRNWEQRRVRPDPAAYSLLRIVDKNPKLALEALRIEPIHP